MIRRNIILLTIKIVVIGVILYLLFFYVFGFMIVKSNNMNPSIKSGSFVILYKLNKEYHSGDVVAIKIKNKLELFRIIGAEDDEILINDKGIFINEIKEDREIYFNTILDRNSILKYPYKIKNNEYFVLNDYRRDTYDSRNFGIISKSNIVGTVITNVQVRGF